MKNDLKELFENMNPSEEQKADMFNNIFYSNKIAKPKKLRVKKVIAVCAAVLILSTISVFGYMTTKIDQYSSEIYKWSTSELAKNLNISDTDKDITVTAESVFGDNENFYILFSLSDEQGNPINMKYNEDDVYLQTNDFTVHFDKNDSYSGSNNAFVVSDINDGRVYFVIHVETQRDEDEIQNIGQNLNVVINGLYTGKPTDVFGLSPENNGVWEFDIPLDYENYGKDYNFNIPFEHMGKTVYLDNFHYSPLDIGIHLRSEDGNLKEFIHSGFMGTIGMAIETTKGRVYPMSSNGKNDGTTVDLQYPMINLGIIKPEEVKGIYYYEKESPDGEIIYEEFIPINITE